MHQFFLNTLKMLTLNCMHKSCDFSITQLSFLTLKLLLCIYAEENSIVNIPYKILHFQQTTENMMHIMITKFSKKSTPFEILLFWEIFMISLLKRKKQILFKYKEN